MARAGIALATDFNGQQQSSRGPSSVTNWRPDHRWAIVHLIAFQLSGVCPCASAESGRVFKSYSMRILAEIRQTPRQETVQASLRQSSSDSLPTLQTPSGLRAGRRLLTDQAQN